MSRIAYSKQRKEEIINEICEGIASGIALKRICKEEGMPENSTFMKWIIKNERYFTLYTRARQIQAHIDDDFLRGEQMSLLKELKFLANQKDVDGSNSKKLDILKINVQHINNMCIHHKWRAALMAPRNFNIDFKIKQDELQMKKELHKMKIETFESINGINEISEVVLTTVDNCNEDEVKELKGQVKELKKNVQSMNIINTN